MAWWKLDIQGKNELTDSDRDNITSLIKEGYIEGELNDEKKSETYFVYSKTERGFWSNEFGWVEDQDQATIFTYKEKQSFDLPYGTDSIWMINPF